MNSSILKKTLWTACLAFLVLAPLACVNNNGGLSVTGPYATPAPTFTPTQASTPGCGFTNVTVPTPSVPAATLTPPPGATPVATFTFLLPTGPFLVIRDLADWQAYCGSPAAPPPPVNFNTQMLVVNVQGYSSPGPAGPYAILTYQSACWNNAVVTVNYSAYYPCYGSGFVLPITLTPQPTPITPAVVYDVQAIAVPASSLPVSFNLTSQSWGACPE